MEHICEYGCNRKATHQLKNKKWCCDRNISMCPYIKNKIKTSFNKIIQRTESKNFILLSKEEDYENGKSILKFRCQKNHEFEMSWESFYQYKSRCPICSKQHVNRRYPIEKIIKYTESRGYKLLTTIKEYRDKKTIKFKFRCPKGHIFEMRYDGFLVGQNCQVCMGYQKAPFNEIINEVENRGYKLLTTKEEYENISPNKLEFKCSKGHIYKTRWDIFHNGSSCPKCINEERRINMLNGGATYLNSFIDHEKKRQNMLNGGAAYIRSFINREEQARKSRERMLGGQAAYMNSFITNPSKPQVELYELIKSMYSTAILNYASLNFSIDIAIPDLNVAIEYDGSYWHQNQEADDKRQKLLEDVGWKFLRYVDYVPSKEEFKKDIFSIL
jgi:hypothetical protein